MWAQEFQGIYDIVKPFPEVPEPNVEKAMKDQKYDVTKLFKLAEEFYTSLGLDPMTDAFWKNSMIVRPKGREVQCHASASDFFTNETDPNKDDFRYSKLSAYLVNNIIYFLKKNHFTKFNILPLGSTQGGLRPRVSL